MVLIDKMLLLGYLQPKIGSSEANFLRLLMSDQRQMRLTIVKYEIIMYSKNMRT